MKVSLRLQLLTCLMVYVSSAHGIMVKYGTKGGPIEPPTPEPLPLPQPYRIPAPVWEDRSDDTPDPNAQWRPPFFKPQPRYTQVIIKSPTLQPATNVQNFVNSYIPTQPIKTQPVQSYFAPSQILSSQSLPGIGIRYFVPAFINDLQESKQQKKQDDAKHNDIETNEIVDSSRDASSDLQWKFEKDAAKRIQRTTLEGTGTSFYQWPAYVHPRH
ncbi:unnamed protein product [Parnassius mnemosyne]|uniref:Uncharacterized protein n=1 Tax=Parnassius mnemosyne TaxID=213953 RepID=A0AAV1M9M1_9NEOP